MRNSRSDFEQEKKHAHFVVATFFALFHGISGPLRNKTVPAGAPDQMHLEQKLRAGLPIDDFALALGWIKY